MKKEIWVILMVIFGFQDGKAQVGMMNNNPDRSAILDLSNTRSKGLLIPRVALTQTTTAMPVNAPAVSLLVFNTAIVNDVTSGFYYWDGSKWKIINEPGPQGIPGVSNTIDTYTATLGIPGITLSSTTTDFTYTQTFFTVPPGKWIVNVSMLFALTTFYTSVSNEYWWIESTFADSPTTGAPPSADIIGSNLINGSLQNYTRYGTMSGMVVVNNTTNADKTYYYMGRVATVLNASGSIDRFGGNYWNEDNIVIQRYE